MVQTKEGLMTRYTLAGAEYFERMKEKGLYTTDKETIRNRIRKYVVGGNIYKEKNIVIFLLPQIKHGSGTFARADEGRRDLLRAPGETGKRSDAYQKLQLKRARDSGIIKADF